MVSALVSLVSFSSSWRDNPTGDYLETATAKGAKIGYDPRLHSPDALVAFKSAAKKAPVKKFVAKSAAKKKPAKKKARAKR